MAEATLSVYLLDQLVGRITRHNVSTRINFDVEPDYEGPATALSEGFALIPGERLNSEHVSNFFGGFLPEGPNRDALAKKARIGANDLFSMLERYGMTMTGALSVRLGTSDALEGSGYRLLSERDLHAKIRQAAQEFDLGNEPDSGRSTIPGFQPKLMLALLGGKWYQPLKGSHSTHIVKPSPARRPETIYDEFFSQQLSRHMGLSRFKSELIPMGNKAHFLAIERYDRTVTESADVVAIHQEDAAQALGLDWIDSSAKFQNPRMPDLNARPSAAKIAELFGTVGDGSDAEVWLQHLMFNVLVGNHDGHAKNVSVIHEGEDSRIADLYDAVPILHINDDASRVNSAKINDDLSLSIGGEFSHHSVTIDHFKSEAKSWGAISPRLTNKIIASTLEQFSSALEETDEIPGASKNFKDRLGYNLDRIAAGKSIGKPKLPLEAWKRKPLS
ncbi:type II toxin-antitoxin system HipA family toxin [Paeniglutamicibacter psychrophenolicus]|uniref:Serine/threonine-protein kinase HipA n=1 Tax=Paeniglutamicibacter psychrophenolicus TaxID=257454 RepID=A0ABS4WIH6_9MICC|nr:HipA domain-containing protein [Paeniglutamicibacter psychrophenolicus]MBP2375988.1 serine/threonine-protein kinase HipA [Paeniglutamicibacter psychrophenolicus]